jgi:methylmalonyl-CoA mutase N-terminal domain/subunit
MRQKMEQVMSEVDAEGGIVKLVAEGAVQARVSAQAYRMQRAIESGEFPKVGVNRYRVEQAEELDVQMHPYNGDDARRQIESLAAARAEREAKRVAEALARVRGAAQEGANVMPSVILAMQAYATVGEVTNELASVYGRYREPVRF